MGIWKDKNNALYDDMGGEAIKLPGWPDGLTKITDAEAQAIRLAADSAPANRRGEILARLAAIDTDSIRPAREIAAALAVGRTPPEFAGGVLAALETEAAALRAELRELPA